MKNYHKGFLLILILSFLCGYVTYCIFKIAQSNAEWTYFQEYFDKNPTIIQIDDCPASTWIHFRWFGKYYIQIRDIQNGWFHTHLYDTEWKEF
jgi:hypothetical protein